MFNNINIIQFADACVNDNSLEELLESLKRVDATDCRNWNLTEDEWRLAIKMAISIKKTEV